MNKWTRTLKVQKTSKKRGYKTLPVRVVDATQGIVEIDLSSLPKGKWILDWKVVKDDAPGAHKRGD